MNIRYRSLAVALVVIFIIGGSTSPVFSLTLPTEIAARRGMSAGEFKPGELLVRFKDGITLDTAKPNLEQYALTAVRTLYSGDVQLVRVPEGRELEIAAALRAEPGVVYAEPNYRYYAFDTIPNDEFYNRQWAHPRIDSPSAWDITTGSTTIIIAIIDSGVDLGHPDLASKLVAGYDFVEDDNDPTDANGHGTHVAGIAAATTNNGTGVSGMSWGAKIMPVRVLDDSGSGYNSDITDGITWAYQNGADIINMSLGGTTYSQSMQDAVNAAHAAGSLVIAAMGNCRTTGPGCSTANPTAYPAAYANVMAVAATDTSDTYAYYSQYGAHCDIAAPGGEMSYLGDTYGIYSTMPTYAVYMTTHYGYVINYDHLQGTSQATPYVSGLAALVWTLAPTLTPDQVQTIIQQTADDLGPTGWDQNYGWGRIDAFAALSSLVVPDPPVLSAIDNADGAGQYTISWSAVAGATSYLLQESNSASFTSAITRYSGPNTQTQVFSQNVGTWYYRVRASNSYGSNSAWSNTQSTSVLPAAPVMSPITNPANADAYTVAWSMVSGATGYTLIQYDSPALTNPITRYVGTSTAYNVTGQPSGTWTYRARATNANLIGPLSTPVSTTVGPHVLPAPVTLTILSDDGDGDYTVDWSDVTGATVYTLEESIDVYFTSPLVVYTGASSAYPVVGQGGGRWHYRVRAAGTAGTSPWSATETAVVVSHVYMPLMLRNYTPPPVTMAVSNGDFESGDIIWTTYSIQGRDVITTTFPSTVTAHGGSWAAWLGGANNESAYLQQPLQVQLSTPYLSYWYWIASTDFCNYDTGTVSVNGTAVKTYDLCSQYATNGWIQEILNLSAYAGQTVTIATAVSTDGSLSSSLFVDDVSFACVP